MKCGSRLNSTVCTYNYGEEGLEAHLNLVLKISGESVYSVCLSHSLVAAGGGPGLHPVHKTLSPTAWSWSKRTVI